MNHPACSASDMPQEVQAHRPAVIMCVFHLIADIGVAFLGIGGAALFGLMR